LTKRLVGLLGQYPLIGIAVGVSYPEFKTSFKKFKHNDQDIDAYRICLCHFLHLVGTLVMHFYPDEHVAIIHDWGKYDSVGREVLGALLASEQPYAKHFTSIAPLKWQTCIPLQPADFMAYEGFRYTKAFKKSEDAGMRKSLQALFKSNVIHAGAFPYEMLCAFAEECLKRNPPLNIAGTGNTY